MIKIVYVIDLLDGDLGGTENQLIKIINGLNRETFNPHLICLQDASWFKVNSSIFQCESTVIEINKFRQPSTYLNILKLARCMKNYKPDVVHTFFPVGNIIGVLAARLAGVRNIISSRRDYGEWMNNHYLFATKFANKFVKKIIVNSQGVRELTEKKENIRNGKVEVIYNGINLIAFNNIDKDFNFKKILNIPGNNKVVGIVANFRPMKHHDTFVKAAYEILKIRQDVSFVLIGGRASTEPIMERMKTLSETLGIAKKLHFTGPQANVVQYLSIMDVGINCSEKEGLSNAIMEYMSAGVPCVVSRAGGNPDLITHNVNGYTYELDDYKTLAKLTLRLLNDEEIRRKFIEGAREKVEREMNLEAMLACYEKTYQRIMIED
jgi:glycosyltransferase involved in cell wall biosynthesis